MLNGAKPLPYPTPYPIFSCQKTIVCLGPFIILIYNIDLTLFDIVIFLFFYITHYK